MPLKLYHAFHMFNIQYLHLAASILTEWKGANRLFEVARKEVMKTQLCDGQRLLIRSAVLGRWRTPP